jgi:hypothetical protein
MERSDPVAGLYEDVIRICEDIEDDCWEIRHDVLDGVLDEEEALRELLRHLRVYLVEVLDLLRGLEPKESREPE